MKSNVLEKKIYTKNVIVLTVEMSFGKARLRRREESKIVARVAHSSSVMVLQSLESKTSKCIDPIFWLRPYRLSSHPFYFFQFFF
jgi:hypothetical protein